MTLFVSSVWLGLAWFAAISLLGAAIVWVITRLLTAGHLDRWTAAQLLALRLGPAVAASAFTTLVFLPVHWRFEPVGPDESFGVALGGLAIVAAGLVGRAFWRASRALRRCAALQALVEPDRRDEGGHPCLTDRVQGICLAGVFHTRIIVGRSARAVLSPGELDVAIAHEGAHARAGDNLKRFAMFCAPDVLGWTRVGRRIEDAWRAAAECQADVRATNGSQTRAVDLASALVKVARLAEDPAASRAPVSSTFHDPSLLETRVRRLLTTTSHAPAETPWLQRSAMTWWMFALPAAIALVWGQHLHRLTEALVRLLP